MRKRELPGVANTLLTTSLREMEFDSLIFRNQYNEYLQKSNIPSRTKAMISNDFLSDIAFDI